MVSVILFWGSKYLNSISFHSIKYFWYRIFEYPTKKNKIPCRIKIKLFQSPPKKAVLKPIWRECKNRIIPSTKERSPPIKRNLFSPFCSLKILILSISHQIECLLLYLNCISGQFYCFNNRIFIGDCATDCDFECAGFYNLHRIAIGY